MAVGNNILLTVESQGVRKEGAISGTPKPGTVMQISAAVEPIGGRPQWEVFNPAADGDQRLIAVLLPDKGQGKTATDAYVSASRGFLYCPLPGDELNMLIADVAGTGDTHAIGDLLMVNDGDGLLIKTTGSPESECFIVMETMAALTADTLVHCMFTGY